MVSASSLGLPQTKVAGRGDVLAGMDTAAGPTIRGRTSRSTLSGNRGRVGFPQRPARAPLTRRDAQIGIPPAPPLIGLSPRNVIRTRESRDGQAQPQPVPLQPPLCHEIFADRPELARGRPVRPCRVAPP